MNRGYRGFSKTSVFGKTADKKAYFAAFKPKVRWRKTARGFLSDLWPALTGFWKNLYKQFFYGPSVLALSLVILAGCGTSGTGTSPSPGGDAPPAPEYRDGEYEGTGQGLRGPVVVRLRIEAGSITGLEIVRHEEDEFSGGPVIEALAELVLENNDPGGIDAVSGATESSAGFLAAVEDALAKAR